MATKKTPSGKRVVITRGAEKVEGILDDDFTFTVESSYIDLLDSLGVGGLKSALQSFGNVVSDVSSFTNKLLGIGGDQAKTFAFKETGIPRWAGTSPITLSIPLTLYAEQNGASVIYERAKKLISWTLPTEIDSGVGKLFGLQPPMPNDMATLLTEARDYRSIKGSIFINIKLGDSIFLHKVLITQAEVTSSTNSVLDESKDQGYPVSIKMNLQIRTLTSATSNMVLDGMNKSIKR